MNPIYRAIQYSNPTGGRRTRMRGDKLNHGLRRQKILGTALNWFTFLKQHCNKVHHRVALGIFAHGS
jgi:hypothetical protein